MTKRPAKTSSPRDANNVSPPSDLLPYGNASHDRSPQAIPSMPAVPPIRAFRTRSHPQNTSNAALRQTNDELSGGIEESGDPALTILDAIAKLERMMEEAVQLAQAGQDSMAVVSEALPVPLRAKARRPSHSIPSKGLQYLNQAGRPNSTLCSPAHGIQYPTKGTPAAPQITGPTRAMDSEHLPRIDEATQKTKSGLEILPPRPLSKPSSASRKDQTDTSTKRALPSRAEIKAFIRNHANPPTQPRSSSLNLRHPRLQPCERSPPPRLKLNGEDMPIFDAETIDVEDKLAPGLQPPVESEARGSFSKIFGVRSRHASLDLSASALSRTPTIDLKRFCHVDVRNKPEELDVFDTCSHAPVARDWPNSRKQFMATVVCINTMCLGMLIGIYAGEVPAIQYAIADFHHFTILGNVAMYSALSVSTLILWPLPLLHGRKSYTLIGLTLAFGLQIPQGLAVDKFRLPDQVVWRALLLLSRAGSGLALGLVNINLQATLLDLFGASLQSNHPHGEIPDPYDARRHGGGIGLWLAAWSWCSIGSITIGFMIGAFIVEKSSVVWGFWCSLLLLMFAITVNIIAPEVRRSAFRRTLADIIEQEGGFSRIARGEVKMHLKGIGPSWWGEEIHAGLEMSCLMLKQPGFLSLALYAAWAYAQYTLVMMLLGALTSKEYGFRPLLVGLCALSLVLGSLLAVPFQKASFLSRDRFWPPRTDSMTFQRSKFWSSHLVRRVLFTVLLPIGGLGYALTSWGPPVPVIVPCILAAVVAYFSNLAIAECTGLILENFDTSDLQSGMTGKPVRGSVIARSGRKRTNFSCYPRVSAGLAVVQSLQYALAAAATGLGGRVERRLGAMRASLVVAAILLGLTLLLTIVLWRWKSVQMIPYRQFTQRQPRGHGNEWEPVILGTPSGSTRKLSILEAGRQTRWSEIRTRNRLNEESME